MSNVAQVRFSDYETSVTKALDLIGAADVIPEDGLIILKPNVVNTSPPPVTTHVECTEAVLNYCRRHSAANIAVGEGCGIGDTMDAFQANGYDQLAQAHDIELIDFNTAPTVQLSHPDAIQETTFFMPEILVDAFVISIPILKDHSFTNTTIAMKNMFGIAPESHYGGSWNKSKLHSPSTDAAVVDLCRYKMPGLSVVDANIALTGMHLAGTPETIGLILASVDPVAVDTVGSQLLGHNPQHLEYLTMANGELGDLDNIELLEA